MLTPIAARTLVARHDVDTLTCDPNEGETRNTVFEHNDTGDPLAPAVGPSADILLARALAELWVRENAEGFAKASSAAESFEVLFQLAPVALLELDSQGLIIRQNPAARALFAGVELGAAVAALPLTKPALASLLEAIRAAGQHGRAVSRLTHAERPHHVEATSAGAAPFKLTLLSLTDTEQVVVKREGGRSAQALRALLRAARDGVVLLFGSEVLYENDAWRKLRGVAGTPGSLFEEVVEGRSLGARLAELAHADEGQIVDVRLGEGTAHEVLAELTAVSVDYEGRECVLVTARDLTARRRLEAQVARSERLASLGMLVAGVAHEINNPLTYALGNLESLHARLSGPAGQLGQDDAEEALRDAIDGCNRIATIIRDLRSFYRADDQDVAVLDPNQVVRDAVRMVAPKCVSVARIMMDLGQVRSVLGSSTCLVQVLINLIVNAIDAMPERDPEQNVVRVSSGSRGSDVRIEVADNGKGIPPAELSRVFEPFFSRGKASGTGLGLTISRNLVEQMNGWIDVDSRVGVGTRFIVHLEAAVQGSVARSSAPPPVSAAVVADIRILVVDDEPLVARSVGRLLASAGEVICVHSVASALDVLALRSDIDVIISDWVMPDGGAQTLLKQLRGRGLSGVPIVVMTGLGQIGRQDLLDGPCVRKPVSQEALFRALAEALQMRGRDSMVVRTDVRESAEFPKVEPAEKSQPGVVGRR